MSQRPPLPGAPAASTDAARLGGEATARRMAGDPEADALWRSRIGAATAERFRSDAFRSAHTEACRRAALRRWGSLD